MGGAVICTYLKNQNYGFSTVEVVNLVCSINQFSYHNYFHCDVCMSFRELKNLLKFTEPKLIFTPNKYNQETYKENLNIQYPR